jgi:hypothetical protein
LAAPDAIDDGAAEIVGGGASANIQGSNTVSAKTRMHRLIDLLRRAKG